MSLISSLPGTLSLLLSLLNQAYLSVISVIWYYTVHFGLNPAYSYPISLSNNHGFMNFYYALFGSIYVQAGGLAMLAAAFGLIATNSFGRIQTPTSILYRAFFAVALSFFSFQICIFVMKFFQFVFLQVWGYGALDWGSLFSVTGTVTQLKASYSMNPFFEVMEFLFLSTFFAGTGALLAVLEIRQALVIFLVLTLPLFSMFFVLRGMDKWALRFWKMFFELNALPFFILIILYNISLFPNDFLLQAAFLLLAASSPYLLVSGGSILSSGAAGIISQGEFFGSDVANPLAVTGKAASATFGQFSQNMNGGARDFSSSLKFGRNTGGIFDESLKRDFNYRRFSGGGNEK